ncbi:MAG: preprotein translocase subunit SecD [Mycobacterium sp.]|nr:preprotein translocase subunit SecD [Mycobacterium sp.]
MASSSPPVHPARYLGFFLILAIGVYLLVFLTGDKQTRPKLGIDLQGGTRVTLTARTPNGSRPTDDALRQAQQIILARVNGLGVSGSEVVIDGDHLVITVPGTDGNEAKSLGKTAQLFIRPVIDSVPIGPQAPPGGMPEPPPGGIPGMPPGMAPSGNPGEPPAPGAVPGEGAPPAANPGESQPPPQPRPYPQEPAPPAPPPPPGPEPPPGPPPQGPPPDPVKDRTKAIAFQKLLRQTPGVERQAAIYLMQTRCEGPDLLAGNDDPNLPLVTCGEGATKDQKMIYVLDKSIISGDQIDTASSGFDKQGNRWVVDLKFKSAGSNIWGDYTAGHVGQATAFVLDSRVVSAPVIREAIPGGNTQITGDFTGSQARELATVLKYGSLPLSFESSQSETVSATLGLTSLRAGLIAGAIGLALVLLYSLLYYRVLGLLTALSLVASGVMVYGILILLGRYINYTLDLAGIAGLIIGIGTTADSFVVFFERIKDEIREGRSFRSAVPRGWARARKTILSGNAVSFLAAAVLYFLAIGQVKGFAFTLGLTTILDVVVVFLVTWPLVYMASKSTLLAKPAFNGLGAVQQIARERRAAVRTGPKGSTV